MNVKTKSKNTMQPVVAEKTGHSEAIIEKISEEKELEEAVKKQKEIERKRFEKAQSKLTECLKELAAEGYGLDADFKVSSRGVIPNIFLARLQRNG